MSRQRTWEDAAIDARKALDSDMVKEAEAAVKNAREMFGTGKNPLLDQLDQAIQTAAYLAGGFDF